MKRLKVINHKNASLSLCIDDRKEEAVILPSEDDYIRKFYDSNFSEGIASLITSLFIAGGFVGVFFLVPAILFELFGNDRTFLLPFIVITTGTLLPAVVLRVWREESLNKIIHGSKKHVTVNVSSEQYPHVSNLSDEQIAKMYAQVMRMRELRKLMDRVDEQSDKDIDEFVRNDLFKRRKDLTDSYNYVRKEHNKTVNEMKKVLDSFVEKDLAAKKNRENSKAINLLSRIDELESKAS